MPETAATKLLLVDDDNDLRETLGLILEHGGFEVRSAANVNEALKVIGSETFDVLVSDLHMPAAGDGLTVVSAMKNSNPEAITIIFSAYPEMERAAAAILAQTDDVFVKPAAVGNLAELIRRRIKAGTPRRQVITSIATILEEETAVTIEQWLGRIQYDINLLTIKLSDRKRSEHLPQLFADLVHRLRNPQPLGSHALVSPAAAEHGRLRREQGYTAAMMVEESRILQVSIFQTLQNNLHRVNFSLLLLSVMEIADEVESQLAQAMTSYIAESKVDALR